MNAPRYTVVGAYSGAVIGANVLRPSAERAAAGYARELPELEPGQTWATHPGQDAGIRITRIA